MIRHVISQQLWDRANRWAGAPVPGHRIMSRRSELVGALGEAIVADWLGIRHRPHSTPDPDIGKTEIKSSHWGFEDAYMMVQIGHYCAAYYLSVRIPDLRVGGIAYIVGWAYRDEVENAPIRWCHTRDMHCIPLHDLHPMEDLPADAWDEVFI